MTILVTGEPGLIRHSTIDALYRRSHTIRLLAPDANAAADEWPADVEPWPASLADADTLAEACQGSEVVIRVAASAASTSPSAPAFGVSLDGLRRLVDAAAAADVRRIIDVGSTDAGAGRTRNSGPAADVEGILSSYPREWLIIRAGLLYGPGDPIVSQLMIMMRALPAVPIVGGANRMQLLWHGDLAEAVARAVEPARIPARQVLTLGGPESITPNELYDRIAELIGRRPVRIPIPEFLAGYGAQLAGLLGLPAGTPPSSLTDLQEDGAYDVVAAETMTRVFGVRPTPLAEGLARLANEQPEQVPSDGVGSMEIKRFWTNIRESPYDATALMLLFRRRLQEIMPIPIGVEPVSPNTLVTAGTTLTAQMPGRGHVQVRVEEASDRRVTFATLIGHPMSGIVRFSTDPIPDGIRFEVLTCDRAANPVDWLMLTLGGAHGQSANWQAVVQKMIELSGGWADGVHSTTQKISDQSSTAIEREIHELIQQRRAWDKRTMSASSNAP
jgi:uncharacterized protein YbjT (DUF2867 family)